MKGPSRVGKQSRLMPDLVRAEWLTSPGRDSANSLGQNSGSVRYTIVLLSSKRLTLKPEVLSAAAVMAVHRVERAPSAPMTNDDSSTHSAGVCCESPSAAAAGAVGLLLRLWLLLALFGCCRCRVSLHTCKGAAT